MELASYVDSLWIVVAGILVMFMQPGFMLVETGFTRSKNSVNIVMKNFMDFSVGAVSYWAFGFALAYGGTTLGGFLAYGNFFLEGDAITYFFQVVFAATAATIVSGAVAAPGGKDGKGGKPKAAGPAAVVQGAKDGKGVKAKQNVQQAKASQPKAEGPLGGPPQPPPTQYEAMLRSQTIERGTQDMDIDNGNGV